jgi:hypothetical protein
MRVGIVTTSLAALVMLAGWAAGASPPLPPKCSSADAQRPGALVHGGSYLRYCGSGRAVVRVVGRSITIKGGRCTSRRVGFGVLGSGPHARGFSLVLDHHNVPGRNAIIDGFIQLPGVSFATTPVTGTAIRSKDLERATFSIGKPGHPARITGSWICGLRI